MNSGTVLSRLPTDAANTLDFSYVRKPMCTLHFQRVDLIDFSLNVSRNGCFVKANNPRERFRLENSKILYWFLE